MTKILWKAASHPHRNWRLRNSAVDTNVNLEDLNVNLLDDCRITGADGQHIIVIRYALMQEA